jgi:hypothetical protein
MVIRCLDLTPQMQNSHIREIRLVKFETCTMINIYQTEKNATMRIMPIKISNLIEQVAIL